VYTYILYTLVVYASSYVYMIYKNNTSLDLKILTNTKMNNFADLFITSDHILSYKPHRIKTSDPLRLCMGSNSNAYNNIKVLHIYQSHFMPEGVGSYLRYSSYTPTFYPNDSAMRNTADVTGGKSIAV
jgi:hypothetical protein